MKAAFAMAAQAPARWGGWLVLSLLSCTPATPSQPGAVEVQFLGRVKLVQPASPAPSAEAHPLPRYLPKQALRMRWQPLPLAEGQCSPFGQGQVQVRFRPVEGAPLLERLLPLKPPWVQPVEGGLVVELPGVSSEGTSPASSAEGLKQGALPPPSPDKQDPFGVPTQPGLYQLELDWRCLPEGPVRTQVYPLRVDVPPEQQPPLMTWLAQLSPQDTPERSATRIEALLEQAMEPEQRLWLRKRQVQLLQAAGAFEWGERAALDMAAAAMASGFVSEQVLALNAAHELAREQGKLDQALRYLDQALERAQALRFEARYPMEHYSRAILFERRGAPLQALGSAYEAQNAARRVGDHYVMVIATQLELQLLQGLGYHHAVNEQLLPLLNVEGEGAERLGLAGASPFQQPALLNNLGWMIMQGIEAGVPLEGTRARALTRAREALEAALQGQRASGERQGEAHILANLAGLALLERQALVARGWLEQARALENPADLELKAYLLRVEAELLALEGRAEALATFERLEKLAQPDAILAEYGGWAAVGQGDLLRQRGRLREAKEAYDRALGWALQESVARSPLHQATLMASRAVWEARAIEIRLEQKTAISALQVLEQGAWQRFHSQTARERHSLLEGSTAVSAEGFSGGASAGAQRQAEQVQSQKLLVLLEERQRAQQRRPPSPERFQSLQRLEQQREILLAELEMGVPPVLNPSMPRLDVGALQRRLASRGEGDDQLLRVTVLPDGVVRWYISSTDLSVDRLSLSRAEVEQQVQALVDALQRGQPLPVEGRRLWEWLREPLQPRGREGEQRGLQPPLLTLVVDGPLRALPWGALPFRGGVLLDEYALRWRPSLLWQPPELKGDGVLVVGNPTQDLPQTEREAERVAEQLSGRWSVQRRVHRAVTREVLLAAFPKLAIFHYAGHAQAERARPYLSHLRLAQGEALSLLDLRQVRLPGTMVFLNACEGGLSSQAGGGALGLADAFLAAGAEVVLSSLWEIPDQVGAALAEHFYQALLARLPLASTSPEGSAEGMAQRMRVVDPAYVLRQAQLELRRQDPAALNTWQPWLVLGGPD